MYCQDFVCINYPCCLFIITDLDQPKIHLTDNRPVERTDVTLNCTASGKPDPTISWTVNGSPLHTSGNSGISFRNGNKELTMMNVNKTDSGEYQCVAHNILGNISSNASKLSVQCKKTWINISIWATAHLPLP